MLPAIANAGVRELLHEEKYADCVISALHDAVPGQRGVIVLRSITTKSESCEITKQQATEILENAFTKFKTSKHLSEITGIYLGRLISYKWLSRHLKESSENNVG